jgi:hypothetical protein
MTRIQRRFTSAGYWAMKLVTLMMDTRNVGTNTQVLVRD